MLKSPRASLQSLPEDGRLVDVHDLEVCGLKEDACSEPDLDDHSSKLYNHGYDDFLSSSDYESFSSDEDDSFSPNEPDFDDLTCQSCAIDSENMLQGFITMQPCGHKICCCCFHQKMTALDRVHLCNECNMPVESSIYSRATPRRFVQDHTSATASVDSHGHLFSHTVSSNDTVSDVTFKSEENIYKLSLADLAVSTWKLEELFNGI